MAKSIIHNHKSFIAHIQQGSWGSLVPGMFVTFNYKKKKTGDKNPMALFIWNEKDNDLIHGLNINYLTRHKVKRLFKIMNMETTVVQKSTSGNERNLWAPYTWVKLPGFSDGSYASTESQANMDSFYRSVVKTKLLPEQGDNIYRTWKKSLIGSLRVINFKEL